MGSPDYFCLIATSIKLLARWNVYRNIMSRCTACGNANEALHYFYAQNPRHRQLSLTSPVCHAIELEKELGQTKVKGIGMLDEPAWHWPDKK